MCIQIYTETYKATDVHTRYYNMTNTCMKYDHDQSDNFRDSLFMKSLKSIII